eukprot:TRINITY_DN20763_c0_g2_i1.p1 TRINITY_DN20763_c0_g2~~TRINITY_DN20763_c0_g2_i1.p1  ORF type:complete len:270 (+),score=43.37 TRINITY_DN20763_c0_g2_i1:18-827(+)
MGWVSPAKNGGRPFDLEKLEKPSPFQLAELCIYLATCIVCFSDLFSKEERPFASSWRLFFGCTSLYLFFERLLLAILLESRQVLAMLPARTYQLKLMYERGFTRIVIFWLLASSLNRNNIVLDHIYSIFSALAWGVLASFHAVLLFDPGAHRRLAAHVGMNIAPFSLGNLVTHGLPCAATMYWQPAQHEWWHGAASCACIITWGWLWTGGSFILDEIYVPAPKSAWRAMWVVALGTSILMSHAVTKDGDPDAWRTATNSTFFSDSVYSP